MSYVSLESCCSRIKKNHLITFTAVVGLLSPIVGCSPDQPNPSEPAVQRSASLSPAHGSRYTRLQEAPFVALAKQEPAIAGFFGDSQGRMHVYVVDPSRLENAVAVFSTHLRHGDLGLSLRYAGAPIIVESGKYTYQELSDWRDDISDQILGRVPGVIYDDLDEEHNRVTLGIEKGQEATVRATLLPILANLGVPDSAVRFSSAGPIRTTDQGRGRAGQDRPASGHAILRNNTAVNQTDTLGGGITINYTSDRSYNCTSGFTAIQNGHMYVATASHCSTTRWGLDPNQMYYRFDKQGATVYIGNEAVDPGPGTCPLAWQCSTYRYSDANLILLNTGTSVRHGVIARLAGGANAGFPASGVDAAHPWFAISNVQTNYTTGQTLEMVGQTSGWTEGTVSATCVDSYLGGLVGGQLTRCVAKASIFAGEGDSGAPIFSWDGGDGAGLYGMEFAIEEQGTTINNIDVSTVQYFSPIQNIFNELGGMSVVNTDIVLGTPTITGTQDISTGAPVVSWGAVAASNGFAGSAVSYQVFRQIDDEQDQTQSQGTRQIYATSGGPGSYMDAAFGGAWAPYQMTTTAPGAGQSYVAYYIRTYYSGMGQNSQTIYYLFSDPNGGSSCGPGFTC